MIQICLPEHCTGCTACANICPKHCIKMKPDHKLGHFIPYIDSSKCIECGLCQKTCPQNSKIDLQAPLRCFAAWEKNEQSYQTSSSGGAATAFSRYILKLRGVVYGCAVQEGRVEHIRVVEEKDLMLLKGSKYVQSFISETLLIQLKQDLLNGLNVLFIGTPCQVSGVKSFLKNTYDNLYLVDIVCHGVPSQKNLITHLEAKIPKYKEITSYTFRENNEWQLRVYNQSEVIYSSSVMDDLYFFGFLRSLLYKDSCYQCRYAQEKRISDITVGDFWGVGILKLKERPKKGLSLILVHTERGNRLFNKVQAELYFEERPGSEAVAGNKQLRFPSRKHFARGLFCKLYRVLGFERAAKMALFFDRIAYSILLKNK